MTENALIQIAPSAAHKRCALIHKLLLSIACIKFSAEVCLFPADRHTAENRNRGHGIWIASIDDEPVWINDFDSASSRWLEREIAHAFGNDV